MKREDCEEASPLISMCHQLRAMRPHWYIEVGRPHGSGWIAGSDLRTASEGPFNALLGQIGERLHTSDRRTIAASFALRYGWSSGIAIAPYIIFQCVPKITLDNVSFKFHENTLFERAALHHPEGVLLEQKDSQPHSLIQFLPNQKSLLHWLRDSLIQQAQPIVEALYDWSHFSIKGTWGMINSSWGSQFINIYAEVDEQIHGLQPVLEFFEGNDLVSQMQPDFYLVTYKNITHVYHRRSTCCRYYRLGQKEFCVSCPIVPHEERLRRNQAWMKRLLDPH